MSQVNAPESFDEPGETLDETHELDAAPAAPVEVRRNGVLSGAVGVAAAVVALAYLGRAAGGGGALDWLLAVTLGAIAAAYLAAVVDARTPLLVLDSRGARVRLGRTWRGVRWDEIDAVEHAPRRGLLRDGRLVVRPVDEDDLLGDLDRSGRRHVALARRLHGSALAFPLSLSSSVTGARDDLTATLEALADDPEQVVVLGTQPDPQPDPHADPQPETAWEQGSEPADETDEPDETAEATEDVDLDEDDVLEEEHLPALPDPRRLVARGLDHLDRLAARLRPAAAADAEVEEPSEPVETELPMVASATPLPLRDPVGGARVEVRFEGAAALRLDPVDEEREAARRLPEADELRRDAGEHDVTVLFDGVSDLSVEPAVAPVVGPELAAARTRLGLTVDQLAARTRIRPHVIESIEADDFAPCGGDFYARGHLRTLARVLGVDAAPLLTTYDATYADAPINARRVFEAELATGAEGPIRSTRGGPNWSVLIAAVMALVLAWSIARLIMDSPVELHTQPVLNGSPSSGVKAGPPVPVRLEAAGGGAHVVVRDGSGDIVFTGNLTFGEAKTLKVSPPVRVQSSDGALQVTVDGSKRGPLGATGQPAQNTFAASQ